MPELVITDAHKAYLSSILVGTDDTAVLSAASRAAHHWGLSPDTEEPTDEEWSAAETAALIILEAIGAGLADGTITVTPPPSVTVAQDDETFNILTALGVVA